MELKNHGWTHFEEDQVHVNMDLDELEHWQQSEKRYSKLALLARDLLTILVSLVASKSAFSLGGKDYFVES